MIKIIWEPNDWNRASAGMQKATRRAVTRITNETARRSNELVPFDTGNLARSRHIKLPRKSAMNIEGQVTYGGPSAAYAVVQHEGLHLWHPPKPPSKSKVGKNQGTGPVAAGSGRGPKYLEYPMKQMYKIMDRLLASEIKKHVR